MFHHLHRNSNDKGDVSCVCTWNVLRTVIHQCVYTSVCSLDMFTARRSIDTAYMKVSILLCWDRTTLLSRDKGQR